jgi:hypothetical protein
METQESSETLISNSKLDRPPVRGNRESLMEAEHEKVFSKKDNGKGKRSQSPCRDSRIRKVSGKSPRP